MAKKIPKKINNAVREYVQILERDVPVEKAIIYGSWAKGFANKKSDIDLAIVSSSFKDLHEAGKYLCRKLWEVKSPIEPVPYSPKSFREKKTSPILAEIRKYGISVNLL